jgi:hypothetical protein
MTTAGGGQLPTLSAALAGTRAGVQTTGPWSGRRQLQVRFAAEAETAQIYTAVALRSELTKASARSRYHSIAVTGRDALADVDFLAEALSGAPALPVMLDHDGQRPVELERLLGALAMVQVTLAGTEGGSEVERVCKTLAAAADRKVAQALALLPGEADSDGALLRIVELVHHASVDAQIVLHSPAPETPGADDVRWSQWLERAMALHDDVRVLPRWPAPVAPSRESGRGTRNVRIG